jgi:hypothetical protein
MLRDGLYQVTTRYLCAGFVVKDGRILVMAPIFRKNNIGYYLAFAKWICP